MADQDPTYTPGTVASNRAQTQGLGVGQKEMDQQRAPDRGGYAVEPDRTEAFDTSLDPTTNADRPSQADFSGQEPADANDGGEAEAAAEPRTFAQVGDLGVGTPANVDIHNIAESDNPELEWGEPAGEGAVFSSNNTRKGVRSEAERGQGARTRQLNKDIVSRRS